MKRSKGGVKDWRKGDLPGVTGEIDTGMGRGKKNGIPNKFVINNPRGDCRRQKDAGQGSPRGERPLVHDHVQ